MAFTPEKPEDKKTDNIQSQEVPPMQTTPEISSAEEVAIKKEEADATAKAREELQNEKDFESMDKLIDTARMGEGKAELTYALLHIPTIAEDVRMLLGEFRILQGAGGVKEGGDRIRRMEFRARELIKKVREAAGGDLTPR